jgi:hypothetical protein
MTFRSVNVSFKVTSSRQGFLRPRTKLVRDLRSPHHPFSKEHVTVRGGQDVMELARTWMKQDPDDATKLQVSREAKNLKFTVSCESVNQIRSRTF